MQDCGSEYDKWERLIIEDYQKTDALDATTQGGVRQRELILKGRVLNAEKTLQNEQI